MSAHLFSCRRHHPSEDGIASAADNVVSVVPGVVLLKEACITDPNGSFAGTAGLHAAVPPRSLFSKSHMTPANIETAL